MGPICCPETSVNSYHTTPRNIPKERRSHLAVSFLRICGPCLFIAGTCSLCSDCVLAGPSRNCGSIPGRNKKSFFSKHSDRPFVPPSLLVNVYRRLLLPGVKWPKLEAVLPHFHVPSRCGMLLNHSDNFFTCNVCCYCCSVNAVLTYQIQWKVPLEFSFIFCQYHRSNDGSVYECKSQPLFCKFILIWYSFFLSLLCISVWVVSQILF
jgi:hypothetical protein